MERIDLAGEKGRNYRFSEALGDSDRRHFEKTHGFTSRIFGVYPPTLAGYTQMIKDEEEYWEKRKGPAPLKRS